MRYCASSEPDRSSGERDCRRIGRPHHQRTAGVDYFVGGFITYTRAMKTEMLGVDPEMLQRFGPVSREVAEAMAQGARRTGATYALSITGNAGPATDGEQAPVGMVHVGLASP